MKIAYWITTVIMCGIFLFSATMYLTKYEMVVGFFEHLGFPVWIIYPLAFAKIAGVIAVLTNLNRTLKEWAYAGFFFDAVLAFSAHYIVDGSGYMMSGLAIVATIASRVLWGMQKSEVVTK